jgi:hypothetical protein
MHAQSPGLDETSTVILYHVGSLQPASFVMPASQLAARHEATQARRTTSASLKTDGPFWAFLDAGAHRQRGQQKRD